MTINQQMNPTPDWSAVLELVQEYIDLLNDPDTSTDTLHDFDSEVFEAVLVAVYGADIFDAINPLLDDR